MSPEPWAAVVAADFGEKDIKQGQNIRMESFIAAVKDNNQPDTVFDVRNIQFRYFQCERSNFSLQCLFLMSERKKNNLF